MDLLKEHEDFISNMESDIHKERFIKRTKELNSYFKSIKNPVTILLPKEQRDVLARQSSGTGSGIKFSKLSKEEQERHATTESSYLWILMQAHPYAFNSDHYDYYKKMAKNNFK